MDGQPSTSKATLCTICRVNAWKYKCPRCSIQTCSLPCSTRHKANIGCSGERDKAAFVPMNQYGWGTMMNDYVLLEEAGRKVGDWGKGIVRGGFDMQGANSKPPIPGRQPYPARKPHHTTTKRDILRLQLDLQDITMELLPVGMERRKLNQSLWNFKSKTASLTIEFIVHPSPHTSTPTPPIRLMTHRNQMNVPLINLIQTHVRDRLKASKKDKHTSESDREWLESLLLPPADEPESFSAPHFVLAAQPDTLADLSAGTLSGTFYHKLDPSLTLSSLLKHRYFVEFPTIHVWQEFAGNLVDESGKGKRKAWEKEELRREEVKRRRIDLQVGKKLIQGQLADYGSDEDELKEPPKPAGLSLLGNYEGSDDDDNNGAGEDLSDSDSDGEVELDEQTLLALVKKAKERDGWSVGNAEVLDWDESEDDESNILPP